jgi:valyl-tRNA synthetase
MEDAFLSYRYNDAAATAYEYFWNDFCDWYVEATKLSMKGGSGSERDGFEKDRATTVLLDVLSESLRLLHPLLPFVTEEIYGRLPAETKFPKEARFPAQPDDGKGGLLISAPYPVFRKDRADPAAEKSFGFLQELVRKIRALRSEFTVSPDKRIRAEARVYDPAERTFLKENAALVKLLAGLGELEITESGASGGKPSGAIGLAGTGFEAFVFIAEAVDMAALKQKFSKEIEKGKKFTAGLESKLANENFLKNAPRELVEGEKRKLEEALGRVDKLESWLAEMM